MKDKIYTPPPLAAPVRPRLGRTSPNISPPEVLHRSSQHAPSLRRVRDVHQQRRICVGVGTGGADCPGLLLLDLHDGHRSAQQKFRQAAPLPRFHLREERQGGVPSRGLVERGGVTPPGPRGLPPPAASADRRQRHGRVLAVLPPSRTASRRGVPVWRRSKAGDERHVCVYGPGGPARPQRGEGPLEIRRGTAATRGADGFGRVAGIAPPR
mmetsp:Transcript_25752/g.51247  ORF Transcript_25752/g.51247 Transcript_25752/m.51247 type:complete len:211 (+) Transcript_25752:106-738(+)